MNEKTGAIIGMLLLATVVIIAVLLFTAPPKGPYPDDMPIGIDFPTVPAPVR